MVAASTVFKDPRTIALAKAVKAGKTKQILKAIQAGSDPNVQGDHNVNLLIWALLHKRSESLSALLSAGANPALGDNAGITVLHMSAKIDDPKYLCLLLDAGVDPDLRNTVTGRTALFDAIISDRDVQFTRLITGGADVNTRDNISDTPLHHAANTQNDKAVLALLKAGADPKAKDRRGLTFQRAFFLTPDTILTEQAKKTRSEVQAWLAANNIAVEGE